MIDEDQDGKIPARTRAAGTTLIVVAVVAWLLIPVTLLRSNPDANTPMVVGYLCAAGMLMISFGGQALARSARVRWWWGILALFASLVFFATWIYVLQHSAELMPLNHGRGSGMPWVAGPLFGTIGAFVGIGLVRSPQRRKLTPGQYEAFEENMRQFRRERRSNFAISMVVGLAVTLVVFAVTGGEEVLRASLLGLVLLAAAVGSVLWGRAVRARRRRAMTGGSADRSSVDRS